jgi:hypothetical protein
MIRGDAYDDSADTEVDGGGCGAFEAALRPGAAGDDVEGLPCTAAGPAAAVWQPAIATASTAANAADRLILTCARVDQIRPQRPRPVSDVSVEVS